MSKDKLTTILGAIAALATVAPGFGLDFGHIGAVTGLTAIKAISLLALGWFTNKQ